MPATGLTYDPLRGPTQITVAVPKLNPGVYQVIVTNFDGQFGISPGTFTAPGP